MAFPDVVKYCLTFIAASSGILPSFACSGDRHCGVRPLVRVVAGETAIPHSWPWQAEVLIKAKDGKFVHKCGGSLIAPFWILTAAHCLFGDPTPERYRIVLGEHDRSKPEGEHVIPVSRIHMHRMFLTGEALYGHDLALMKLARPAMLSPKIQTVCLPRWGNRAKIGRNCYITGWGKLSFDSGRSETLQQARLAIVSTKNCAAKNNKFQKVDGRTMVCATGKDSSQSSGCHGDSGGPFVCEEKGRWVLRGVVSWGDPKCRADELYSVFARVSTFVNWIKANMLNSRAPWPEPRCVDTHFYCNKWLKSGVCSQSYYEKTMKIYCRKTCGLC